MVYNQCSSFKRRSQFPVRESGLSLFCFFANGPAVLLNKWDQQYYALVIIR